MADIRTNQSKVYNALKGMGFSGIGANEEEFASKMSNPKNREKVYNALSSKGYKGIGKDLAAFDSLIYQAQQPVSQPAQPMQSQSLNYSAPEPQPVQQPQQKQKQPSKDALTGKPISPYVTGEGAHQPFIGAPEQFEPTYDLGNGQRRKVSDDEKVALGTSVTPAVQQVVDRNGNVVKENVITPVEPQEVAYDRYLKESRNNPTPEEQNQKRLDEVNKKLAKANDAEQRETLRQYAESPYLFVANAMNMAGGSAPGGNMQMANSQTQNRKYLEARQQLLSDNKRIIDEVRQEAGEGDGVLTGLKQAVRNVAKSTFKGSTWDFGATDLNTQTRLLEAASRADNGEATNEDYDLLNDFALSSMINSNYANQLSGWAKAGQVTGESLPFMLEMAMNPASGMGKAAQKGLVRMAVNKYGKKWVKDHAKSVLASKIATRVAGDILGGQAMAASTGMLRTIADAESRMTGKAIPDVDDKGNIIYGGHTDGDSAATAFTKAWVANGIENSSEMWGEYLAPVTGLLGKAIGKAAVGKAGREALNLTGRLGDVNLNRAQRFIFDVTSRKGMGALSQGLDNFLKKTQWHGVFGEYVEEELGNLANAATVGDMTFDDAEDTGIFNLQQHLDTFSGVALMGGFMSALHTGSYALDRYNNRMSKIDDKGSKMFADWDETKTIINSVLDDSVELNNTLTTYLGDKNLTPEAKRVILDYTAKALEKKGAEMAEYQPRMDHSTTRKEGDGFVVDSVDTNGNVISSQTFKTEDEAKAFEGELKMRQQQRDMKDYLDMTAGLSYGESASMVDNFLDSYGITKDNLGDEISLIQDPNTNIGKAFREFKNQRAIEKARASREAIASFEEQNGWEPGTVRELTESDPMQMDETELAMADQAKEFLKGLAYPAGEVHIEMSQQEGADAASDVVEQVASNEGGIDPNNNAGQQITEQWKAARHARNELFLRNEDLMQEVTSMEQAGLSPQEILSSLDTFSPQDRQILTDYYNYQARFQSFLNTAEQKINEEAANSRQRHTMKGTINGTADVNNVYTISDGTNEYYLVSGNITTDSATGQITGSDSGLIIGMDMDGSFVNIGDANGYSVMPVTQSLDQFEEAERIRLQEQVTGAIDPNGTMAPQQQVQQPGAVGGEAGVANDTGANEPLTPEAATPETPQGTALESIPKDEGGNPLYEQAEPEVTYNALVEQVGDAANVIAKKQLDTATKELEKLNKKLAKGELQGNTIQEQIQETQALQQAIAAAQARVNYWQSVLDVPTNGNNAQNTLNNQPQNNNNTQNVVSLQPKAASNQTVEDEKQQRIAEAKARYGDLFDDDFTKANDVYELASMWVGRKRNLAWEDVNGERGLQKELGWTRKIGGDTKYIETLLAKNGEGMPVDAFVHMVWESPENDILGEKRWSTEEIKEALLDLLKSAQSKSDVVDYALNTRIAQAEAAFRQQQQMEEEEEANGGTPVAENQPVQEGSLPFPPATSAVENGPSETTPRGSVTNNETINNEQGEMGSQNQEGDGGNGGNATASDVLRGVSVAASEAGQGSGSKERLLAQLEESAKDSGYWVEDSVDEISDLKVNVGGENEVYKTEDGANAIKLNNFAFLRDDATDFEDFFNRLESFNELFPDVAIQVVGFAKNSKGEVCVVLQQPWVEAEREATEKEIDDALEEMDFYTDRSGNWTDGRFIISDLKPNNVLVDKYGNLHFIDVVTFDETKPGQMMKAKKPEANPETQDTAPVAQNELSEREQYIADHPLSVEEIEASDASPAQKILSKQYLNSKDDYVSEMAKAAYTFIYNKKVAAQNKPQQTTAPEQPATPSRPTNEAPTRPQQAEAPQAETPAEAPATTPPTGETQNSAQAAAKARMAAALAKLKKHGKKSDNNTDAYSIENLTPEQIEDMFEVVEAGAELGYTLLDGVQSKDEWIAQMREAIAEPLKDATGYNDTEVDELLNDMWNYPYAVEGETKTVSEWASDKGINVNEIENETGESNGDNTPTELPGSGTVGSSTEAGVEQGGNNEGNAESGGETVSGTNTAGVNSGTQSRGQATRGGQRSGGTGSTRGKTGGTRKSEQSGNLFGEDEGNGTNDTPGIEQGGTVATVPEGGIEVPQTDGKPKKPLADITQEKAPYKPASIGGKYAIGSVIPSGIADSIANAFKRLKEKFFPKKGSTLDFVREELGYKTNEEMLSDFESGKTDGLAAEQVDAVALAIGKMKDGKSFIVGDMTGVGKGRTAAALIRWGLKHGKKVLFVTEKSGLFSDMYRDLTDIGSDYLPFVTNSDTDANITDADGNKVIPKPMPAAQKALWQSESDKLPRDKKGRQYDFVMTTYSQVSGTEKGDKKKAEWLKEYAKDAIVIMDESHNASGESNTGAYFRDVVENASGVTFLSATYAKRPDNMLLYAIKSSMSAINMPVQSFLDAIKEYGVAMQELMASALFGSGEMIRRERDMSDVKTTWTDPREIYTEEEYEECRKTSDKTMALINDIIQFQRDYVNPIVSDHEKEHEQGNAMAALIGAPQTHTSNTSYKSQVSNIVNLMVYAMKAKKAAEMAIEQIKQGKKPVIAVSNTMGSYIDELGDDIPEANFMPIFEKGVKFALKYVTATYEQGDDGKYHKVKGSEQIFNAEDELSDAGQIALENLRHRIEEYFEDTDKVDLSLSPIDLVKQMIADAGYSCGEITGRSTQLVRKEDGGYQKTSIRQNKKEAARKFNGGSKDKPIPEDEQYQALILNVAGATGISLHSSKKFGNQQPRTMIILQPNADVNKEVQMRGRIDRTGQVHRGEYFYMSSPIPAEQKITMMLKQKLASLDAQSVGTKQVSSNKVEGQDMDNKYGDEVCFQYLLEHLNDVNAFLENGLQWNRKTREWEGRAGLLYDVLKDLQRMPCEMQEKVIAELSQRYSDQIEYLNQNGINDLETATMDLGAVVIDDATFVKGKDNESVNEFAHDTTIERVEVNVLKKPMRSADIKKKMKELDALDEDGLPKEGILQQTSDKVEEANEKKIEDRKAKYEEQEAKLEEKVRAEHPQKPDQTDESYEEMVKGWPSLLEMKNKHKADLEQYAADLGSQHSLIYRAAMWLKPGRPYLVPLTDDISDSAAMMYGRFLGFQMKNGDTRQVQAVFAVKDSRAMITIPVVNQNKVIERIIQDRYDMEIVSLEKNENGDRKTMEEMSKTWDEWWDKMIPKNTTRQVRYMITGNVLQACGSLGKYKGQIITFTRKNKETGEITLERGMLLAENFDPENFQVRRPVEKKDVWESYDEIKDDRSGVSCHREGSNMVVKFEKRKGEKLADHPAQKDQELKDLAMNGEIRPSGKTALLCVIKEDNVEKALEHLYKEYGYTKEELFVMPDSTEKPDAIVRTNRPWQEIINELSPKYGNNKYSVDNKIRQMLKRYKMDVNNEGLKNDIREAVQLRQAFLRKEYADQESNRLAWEVLILDERIERYKDDKDYREDSMRRREAIIEELEYRGFKGTALHLEQGKMTTDDVRKLFDSLNNDKTPEGKAKKALFEKVMSKVSKLPMEIFLNEKIDNDTGGFAGGRVVNYNWKYMNADYIADQAKADTILHELIHTVTAYADRCVEDGLEHLLDQDMIDAINELHSIFDAIKNDDTFTHDGVRAYGLTNVREMLSEAGSNSEFRNDLKKTGLWARLKAGFLAFFGIKKGVDMPGAKQVNAYEQIMERLDYLIENFKQEAWEEYYKGTQYGGYGYKRQDAQKISTENPMEAINQAVADYYGIRLSEQKDQNDSPFVLSSNNTIDFGQITPDKNIAAAPIRLSLGDKDNGYIHIERRHGDQIRNAGYANAAEFVEYIANNFTDIVKGEAYENEAGGENQTYLVQLRDGHNNTIWMQLSRDGSYWNVNSAGVMSKRYGKNKESVWSASEVQNGGTATADNVSRVGSKADKESNPNGTTSNVFNGKDRKKVNTKQENRDKKAKINTSDPIDAIQNAADRFKDGQVNNPLNHSAKAIYNERLNTIENVFTEAYQDAMISLKTAQNAIAKDQDIPDSQNAYMAENLMHGKNKNEMDLFNRMFRDPLISTINKIMTLTGMNWGDVDRYVYSKSGLERNREFFVRDWLEAQRNEGNNVDAIENRWQKTKQDAYDKLKNGDITFPEYLGELTRFIRSEIDSTYIPSNHDYSGFRAMYGDEDGKYDEGEIIDEVMDAEVRMEADNVETLWSQINDATRYGLERYREAGMRSDEQIDRVEGMFNFYVPMRGFKEDTGEDMYQYFTSKSKAKSYVGGLLKHAKGRGSEASYPISTIFAMSYKAISDCNQNLVNQKLYRLCQANPNDLVVLSDSWAVYNDITDTWEEAYPHITDDMDEEEVRQTTLDWEQQMKDLAEQDKARKITGKAKFDYVPMDKRKKSEHIIDVRINGQPKHMIVTSNPRMAQALNGQLRFERGKNVFSKWNAAIKNMMAAFFTSYSPTFALRNMFRDWTHFRTMLGVREGRGYAQQANKYYRQSLFKMVNLFKKYREGTLDDSKEIERDFKDFMDNGGITGFVQMMKIDDIQKQMEKLYKDQKEGKPIKFNNKLWDVTLGAIEALNEGIENNARFATYRASRHYAGRTKARSAYDAKEITVNFNKKGAGSKTFGYKSQNKMVEDAAKAFGVTSQILGEGKIFFNATVQAIATTFKNFQNPDGSINKPYVAKWAAKYALPPFMFGMLLPYVNRVLAAAFDGDGGDDDPYANLPEWTRRKNLCIYIGNDNFITIPIGQELAAFLALGDMAAGMTYAPNLKPVDRSFGEEMVGIMNTFSPVDIDTKITKGGIMEDPISEVTGRTFSVLAPLVAVEQNLGWTGRPIYREDKFQNDQYTPEYQMVYSSTNPVLVNASKLLHELGGGDDITRGKLEVNPAIIQYLWEQYTGGPGKVFSNTISIGKDAKDILSGIDSDFNIRKVEGLKAFVQQGDDRTAYYRTQAKYRKYKEDAERLYDAVRGYESGAAENPDYVLKLEEITKGDDFVRMQIVREADKTLSQINKAANKAEGKERKELRRLYNLQVKEVVDLLDQVGQ